jgi:hypothetical protein
VDNLRELLADIAKSVEKEALTFKTYGTKGRQMATTRTINLNVPAVEVPGTDGKVGRMQVTFCVNFLDIAEPTVYAERTAHAAEKAIDVLTPELRAELFAKYNK